MEEGMENGAICRLFIDDPTRRLVATGKVYNLRKHHGKEISPDALKDSYKWEKRKEKVEGIASTKTREQESDVPSLSEPEEDLFVKFNNGTFCRLFLEDPTKRLVAIGKAYNLKKHHGKEISPDALKVSIDNVIHGESKVPYTEVEIKTVGEGTNSLMLWPKKLIKLGLDG